VQFPPPPSPGGLEGCQTAFWRRGCGFGLIGRDVHRFGFELRINRWDRYIVLSREFLGCRVLLALRFGLDVVFPSDVAAGTGLADSTISEILAGKRKLSVKHVEALARFFKVKAAVFLNR
jgi:hypothetical protein